MTMSNVQNNAKAKVNDNDKTRLLLNNYKYYLITIKVESLELSFV